MIVIYDSVTKIIGVQMERVLSLFAQTRLLSATARVALQALHSKLLRLLIDHMPLSQMWSLLITVKNMFVSTT